MGGGTATAALTALHVLKTQPGNLPVKVLIEPLQAREFIFHRRKPHSIG